MIITTYECDICGQKVTQSTLYRVHVHVQRVDYASLAHDTKAIHICEECLGEMGIRMNGRVKPITQAPPLSVEDLIRTIVQEEIENARNQADT